MSHLRLLGTLSVASYDSQGLRWKCSYRPPHGVLTVVKLTETATTYISVVVLRRTQYTNHVTIPVLLRLLFTMVILFVKLLLVNL
jgi:hypothetical protein